jgi:hypothetical protein
MIIYSDSLIYLDYDPKTDILWVKWPHFVDEPSLIVRPTIDKILESIKYFNVGKVLIDTKNTGTNISEEEFKKLSKEFVAALSSANLKKLARVIYAEPIREIRARILIDALSEQLGADFKSQEFTDVKSAFAWLEKEEN